MYTRFVFFSFFLYLGRARTYEFLDSRNGEAEQGCHISCLLLLPNGTKGSELIRTSGKCATTDDHRRRKRNNAGCRDGGGLTIGTSEASSPKEISGGGFRPASNEQRQLARGSNDPSACVADNHRRYLL